jgi:diguanylate cyclase (GGDEF)-like protein
MALCVTTILPASYFLSNRSITEADLQAKASLGALVVSQVAMRNADLWIYENARIRGLLTLLGQADDNEARRVFDSNGRLVAEQEGNLTQPVLSAVRPIYDSGVVIGHMEVSQSIRPVVVTTTWVALLATVLGCVTFLVLKLIPLRLLRQALTRAAHLATHDALTHLPNRALFRDRLEQALARMRREGGAVAVLCLDLDRFKEVNDVLGHAAGDELLRQVTWRLAACLREMDTLARLGGDEFAIVQVGAHQPADAEALARRMVAALAEPFDLNGHQACIGTSVGVALRNSTAPALPSNHALVGTLLQEGDLALYRSKAEGRGTYRFFEMEMNQHLHERRALEADLRKGIAEGQFRLHFQPQMDLAKRQIYGAEALIRWSHPRRGSMRPDEFIPLSEETGLIIQIGEWVLRQACHEAVTWPKPLKVAVNVSPVQFRKPGFVETVGSALLASGLDPARLELEVTEGIILQDTNETLRTLWQLRELGVTIAMDDFGTGYSSLGYLQKFTFDKIKIDRSFIRGLGVDPNATAIVHAVLGMAHALGIRVNAEGVEDEQQALLLTGEGCDEVQGFLFSRPIPSDEFVRLMVSEAAPLRVVG